MIYQGVFLCLIPDVCILIRMFFELTMNISAKWFYFQVVFTSIFYHFCKEFLSYSFTFCISRYFGMINSKICTGNAYYHFTQLFTLIGHNKSTVLFFVNV